MIKRARSEKRTVCHFVDIGFAVQDDHHRVLLAEDNPVKGAQQRSGAVRANIFAARRRSLLFGADDEPINYQNSAAYYR